MKLGSLVRRALLFSLMAGAVTLAIIMKPPRSRRQEAFNRWLTQVSGSDYQQIIFALREDWGNGNVTEYKITGTRDAEKLLRLVRLAQEAELFRSEPVTDATGTPENPVTEVVISGVGNRFMYRDHRHRFNQAIAARSLRTLAELFSSGADNAH